MFRVIAGLKSRERAGYCTFNGLAIAAKDSPAAFVLAGDYVGDGLTRDELLALHVATITKAHEIWARKQAEKQHRSNRWRLGLRGTCIRSNAERRRRTDHAASQHPDRGKGRDRLAATKPPSNPHPLARYTKRPDVPRKVVHREATGRISC